MSCAAAGKKIRPPDSVCACELFLNRDLKSYGDKSPPRHTNSTIYNPKGEPISGPCLPCPLTMNAERRAIFSHSATKSIKGSNPEEEGAGKKSFKGSGADWVEGAAADCALPCRQALAGTTHRRKRKKRKKGRAKRRPPFLFSPYSPRLRKQA